MLFCILSLVLIISKFSHYKLISVLIMLYNHGGVLQIWLFGLFFFFLISIFPSFAPLLVPYMRERYVVGCDFGILGSD